MATKNKTKTTKKIAENHAKVYMRYVDVDRLVLALQSAGYVYETLHDVVLNDSTDFGELDEDDVVFELTITPVHRIRRKGAELVPYE